MRSTIAENELVWESSITCLETLKCYLLKFVFYIFRLIPDIECGDTRPLKGVQVVYNGFKLYLKSRKARKD